MSQHRFQRQTRQREVILEELQKLTSHPTAADLYEIVRRRLPRVSLGTVYRNLELMSEMGVVCKLQGVGNEARFDGNCHRHDHVRCVECGRVADVHAPPLDLSYLNQDHLGGFTVVDHRLELRGVCPECMKRRSAKDGPENNLPSAKEEAEGRCEARSGKSAGDLSIDRKASDGGDEP